ncbi:hypothetical protein ACHAQH_005401 [Verticillium albo-atrum]
MSFPRRAPGLTAKGVKPLLSQVNGKKVARGPERKLKPVKTPEDIFAAPLSSSDDEDSDTMSATDPSPRRRGSFSDEETKPRNAGTSRDWNRRESDSESDDVPVRGEIKATKFHGDKGRTTGRTSHNTGSKQESGPRPLRSRDANLKTKFSASRKRDHAEAAADSDALGEPSAKRRASSPGEKGAGGEHLEDVFHQTKVKASQRKYGDTETRKMTYRGRRSPTPDSSLNTAQSSSPMESRRKAFKDPGILPPSPEGSERHSKRGSKFKTSDTLPPSPVRKPRRSDFKTSEPLPEEMSPKRPRFKKPDLLPTKSGFTRRKDDLSVPYVPPQGKPAMRVPGRRKKMKKLETPPEPKTFVAGNTFKLPASLPGMGLDDFLDRPCDSGSPGTLSLASDDESEDSDAIPVRTIPDTCPMCELPVDKELLRTFSKGRPLGINQQIKFCRLHNSKSAEATWLERGYPEIDWDALPSRFSPHYKSLKRIMNGEGSHYKSILADKVSEGRERTLRKTERSLAPGYYGPRGLRIMSEHLISRFASALRRRAVEDELVAARGSAVFVSTVLVPELASQLIMEDMSVGIDEARTILEESVPIGDLLHEEIGDIVVDDVEGHGDAGDDVFL